MSRRLPCAALAALLATPAAFAADHASLTIYHADNDALFSGGSQGTLDAGHALVHEQRTLSLQSGNHQVRIGGLPATLDPEAVAIALGSNASVRGQRVVLANASANGALDGAIGSQVSVLSSGMPAGSGGSGFSGELLGISDNGVLVRMSEGKVHLFHDYASVTLPADSVSGGSTLLLDVDAKASGDRDARLSYTTSGLGWRAAYRATLAGGAACRMQFKPEASIANRSGRDYDGATIKLVAGQPNLGNRSLTFQSIVMKGPAPMAAAERAMPAQASLGDYRSYTLPGTVDLPKATVTLTPLYPAQTLSCQREYVVEDGGIGFPPKPNTNDYGAQDYQDRAITSTLAFTAPDALPAGTLRAWTIDREGAPALLGQGGVDDTPKGQRVAVQLGQSFDLRASRERTAFHVDANTHTMTESYKIALANGGDSARSVTVREHPNRWREWSVISSSVKPSKQTPQLLEFVVTVPAHGSATLAYTVKYNWNAQDL